MRRGLARARTSYPRPKASTAPWAKLSITMSDAVTSRRKRARPSSEPFRSMVMLRLLRLRKWKFAEVPAGMVRDWSPSPGRSTLTTSAPRSASSRPADGPAMMWPSSRARRPSSGSAPAGVVMGCPSNSMAARGPSIEPAPAQQRHQILHLLVHAASGVGAVGEVRGAIERRGGGPDGGEVLLQRDAGIHARTIGGADTGGERGQLGLEEDGHAGAAERVAVPCIADGAPAQRADGILRRGEALDDVVLALPERQPPLLAHELVEAPAELSVQLAVEVEEGAAEPGGQPPAERGLPGADQAREVDIHRAAASRAA